MSNTIENTPKTPARKDRIDAFAATSLVLFSALLGLNQVLVKVVNEGLSPMFQAGLRSLFAFPLVLLFCWFMRKRVMLERKTLVPGVACGILFAGEFILLFVALDFTTVARASIFFYTMPFWMALAAHFLIDGERLSAVRITGLVLAFAGVVLALSTRSEAAGPQAWIGDLFCLLAATMWATIALILRLSRLSKANPESQLLYQLIVSAPIMLGMALFFGPMVRELELFHLGILAFQVVVVASFGFAFWFWILSIYPASDMASFGFLAPVFGVAFGWLLLGEPVGFQLLLALVLVGIGIVLVNRRRRPLT